MVVRLRHHTMRGTRLGCTLSIPWLRRLREEVPKHGHAACAKAALELSKEGVAKLGIA
jgi:hypothetical protein